MNNILRKISAALLMFSAIAANSSAEVQQKSEPGAGQDTMMNNGGMMGMMTMMMQMNKMMGLCNQMMASSMGSVSGHEMEKPIAPPAEPEKKN